MGQRIQMEGQREVDPTIHTIQSWWMSTTGPWCTFRRSTGRVPKG